MRKRACTYTAINFSRFEVLFSFSEANSLGHLPGISVPSVGLPHLGQLSLSSLISLISYIDLTFSRLRSRSMEWRCIWGRCLTVWPCSKTHSLIRRLSSRCWRWGISLSLFLFLPLSISLSLSPSFSLPLSLFHLSLGHYIDRQSVSFLPPSSSFLFSHTHPQEETTSSKKSKSQYQTGVMFGVSFDLVKRAFSFHFFLFNTFPFLFFSYFSLQTSPSLHLSVQR